MLNILISNNLITYLRFLQLIMIINLKNLIVAIKHVITTVDCFKFYLVTKYLLMQPKKIINFVSYLLKRNY